MKKILILVLFSHHVFSQVLKIEFIEPKVNSSFRGLSVVNDQVAWVSGSNGWIGVSVNGGHHWEFRQVKKFEKSDFRTLYAFTATKAVIANVGSPASILLTSDGGITWTEVYRNETKEAFLDGVDFWNDIEGVIYGDPIQGKMTLLRTRNSGNTWSPFNASESPVLVQGEASFAASGTGLRCYGGNKLAVATGGLTSHLFLSQDKGKHWKLLDTPIIQGKSSTGIFSVAVNNEQHFTIVGGDYLIDTLRSNHVFYSHDGGATWQAPQQPTRGYRECVEFYNDNVVLSVGPSGTDISHDNGMNWEPLSDEKGFHVIRKARQGSLTIMAGSKGRIGLIK